MKRFTILIQALVCIPCLVFALNNFDPKTEWISFAASSPPGFFYISDSNGNRAGANPTLQFNSFGEQGDGLHGLEEIPNSKTDQENIQNAITGQPSKHTTWSVHISDLGKATYTVTVTGLVNGQGQLNVFAGIAGHPSAGKDFKFSYFIATGSTRQFAIAYTPNQSSSSVTITPVVGNGDLLSDVKIACQLGKITSSRVCKRLTDKAKEIQDALEDHHNEDAKALLKSFLSNLGDLKGDGDDDRDDHDAIQEPALDILIADAKAILSSLPDQDHHDHGDR